MIRATIALTTNPVQRQATLTLPIDQARLMVLIAADGTAVIELTPFQAQQLGTMLLEAAENARRAAAKLENG